MPSTEAPGDRCFGGWFQTTGPRPSVVEFVVRIFLACFVEEIGCSVVDARDRSVVLRVAAGGRRQPSSRVQTLNEGDVRHSTASLVRYGLEQQPRYRFGIRREGSQLGTHHL